MKKKKISFAVSQSASKVLLVVAQKFIKSTHELTGLLLTRIYRIISGFDECLKSTTAECLNVKNEVKQNAFVEM